MSRKKPLIFSTTDFFGNLVTLTEETWQGHILIEHSEMAGCETLVEDVIKRPHIVRVSAQSNTGIAFISDTSTGPGKEGIRVLVNYGDASYEKGASTGGVMTAYPVDTIKYSNPQLGRVIYKKGGGK